MAFYCVCVFSLSVVRPPQTIALQAPLSVEFSWQEYWNGLPFPPPGTLPQLRDGTHISSISCIGKQILYHWATLVKVAQLCPTLCNSMDCQLPSSSADSPWSFQARILEWVAISFSRGSSQPRDRTQVSLLAGRRFTIWTTGQPLNKTWFFNKRT